MSGLFDLTGKKAFVTGASSGLGRQMALALARQGADVAILARRLDKLEKVRQEIEALGVQALAVQCDVTKNDQIQAAVAKTVEAFGRIDILCDNAGIGLFEPAEAESDETWEAMIATNLNAVFYVAREVGKQMVKQNYGKIICTGSIHSQVAMTGLPLNAYATTKGGVRMLVKSLAVEWAKYNITVNAIGPAYFESEMTSDVVGDEGFQNVVKTYCPMGRIGRTGELDGAIVYFASDASSYTTGQLLCIDGGWTAI